jgi:lipopolysaccharide transport system ATP-binding protein
MGTVAIRAEVLGKRYRIGERERYLALRDALVRWAKAPARLRARRAPEDSHIWALRDVSFEVPEGEAVGIIGRNGAGKTTLLKILARVTDPTEGYAEVRGRVGSLLEVGTGFHPELTGRENVFLSGAILGMSKRDIQRRFDEIVEFAGVERFIDTPLKRYSAGMQMRLAFAVAAHLEPDILLVDEVLAVGDIEFQRKCLGKMEEVEGEGRTVIFVSHQMNQIRRLCQRVLWLDGGHIAHEGPTAKVTAAYEAAMSAWNSPPHPARDIEPNVKARFLGWEIVEPRGLEPHVLTELAPTTIKFHFWAREDVGPCQHGIVLYDTEGRRIWGWAIDGLRIPAGRSTFVYHFPMFPVRPGPYSWLVGLQDHTGLLDYWHVVPLLIVATEHLQHPWDHWSGVLNIPVSFEVSKSVSRLDAK